MGRHGCSAAPPGACTASRSRPTLRADDLAVRERALQHQPGAVRDVHDLAALVDAAMLEEDDARVLAGLGLPLVGDRGLCAERVAVEDGSGEVELRVPQV